MGEGDIYVYPTGNSPFEFSPAYRVVAALCRSLNPWIFVTAIAGCLLALLRRQQAHPDISATALMLTFVTLVYSLLQAEPRYSTPFRGLEIMLAMFALYRGTRALLRLREVAKAKPANS